jgi:probable phosphoglycerate mutase
VVIGFVDEVPAFFFARISNRVFCRCSNCWTKSRRQGMMTSVQSELADSSFITAGGEMATEHELWLVRHGETTRSASNKIAGWSDPPLTPRGRRQAEALRPFFDGRHFDSVWSSDLERAASTSRLAWGDATKDRRLREVNFGDLEGHAFEDLDPELHDGIRRFRELSLPGGESLEAVRGRVKDFLGELPFGRHLLFTHGGVIRLLTQDLGVDHFVPTGSVVAVAGFGQRLIFVREPRR